MIIQVRLKSKVRTEIHNSKLSGYDYLAKLPDDVILLDEVGEEMSSFEFSKRFEKWTISTSDVHLAVRPRRLSQKSWQRFNFHVKDDFPA